MKLAEIKQSLIFFVPALKCFREHPSYKFVPNAHRNKMRQLYKSSVIVTCDATMQSLFAAASEQYGN